MAYVIKSSRLKSYLAYICHEIQKRSHKITVFLSVLTTLGIIAIFYYIAVFSYGTRLNHRNNIAKYGYIVGNGDRRFRQLDLNAYLHSLPRTTLLETVPPTSLNRIQLNSNPIQFEIHKYLKKLLIDHEKKFAASKMATQNDAPNAHARSRVISYLLFQKVGPNRTRPKSTP